MLKQTGLLIIVGPQDYAKLNKTQKEKVSDSLGALSGAGLGFASISAVVGGLGITGLSGVGIMSGLAILGGIVGAGAVGGIIFVAGVPVVAGVAGYGLIKGVKYISRQYRQKNTTINLRWETNSITSCIVITPN